MRTTAAAPWIVMGVGIVACLAAVGLIFGLVIAPTQQRIADATARYNAAYDESTTAAQNAAQKTLDDNNATAASIRAAWHVKETTLMPPYDVSKRDTAWKQLAHELSENLGPSLERWMARSGVVQMSGISIMAPPSSPNLITGSPLTVPVNQSGNMSVGGDFRSLLGHVLKWNDFNRLVLIDNVQLSGNSPYMTASYNAKVIIFPQNGDKPGPTITKSGTGSGSAGGGTYAGGYGGGPAGAYGMR